jgi:lipid II:glycine glycyltransferase (peptidoglycan interpeptide bridge formation enzyme)
VISKDRGFVVLASCKGKVIAGGVFFHFGTLAFYKYGASDRRHQHLRANNLVMWEAIKWFCQKKYKSLCLGKTEAENEGLLRFKSGWGPSEYPINYYRYDLKKRSFVSGSNKTYGFHNSIFRSTPVPVLNRIGALFYRHVG